MNDEKTITLVVEFPTQSNRPSVILTNSSPRLPTSKPLSNHKFYSFVITKDNFQLFYRTKALDEYLTFFDRNYQKQNQ
ncbi:MAG: hypothetical protein U5K54_28900 [Cytophagales bacterium]|nr:hypothetical protein [Cytophagales bacterium]